MIILDPPLFSNNPFRAYTYRQCNMYATHLVQQYKQMTNIHGDLVKPLCLLLGGSAYALYKVRPRRYNKTLAVACDQRVCHTHAKGSAD